MLGVAKGDDARHHDRGDHAQSPNDLLGLVDLSQMRMAGREKPIGDREVWSLFQGLKKFCRRLIKPAFEEECGSDRGQSRREALAWVEALKGIEMLERQVRVTGKGPQQPAPQPAASKTGID